MDKESPMLFFWTQLTSTRQELQLRHFGPVFVSERLGLILIYVPSLPLPSFW